MIRHLLLVIFVAFCCSEISIASSGPATKTFSKEYIVKAICSSVWIPEVTIGEKSKVIFRTNGVYVCYVDYLNKFNKNNDSIYGTWNIIGNKILVRFENYEPTAKIVMNTELEVLGITHTKLLLRLNEEVIFFVSEQNSSTVAIITDDVLASKLSSKEWILNNKQSTGASIQFTKEGIYKCFIDNQFKGMDSIVCSWTVTDNVITLNLINNEGSTLTSMKAKVISIDDNSLIVQYDDRINQYRSSVMTFPAEYKMGLVNSTK